MFLSSFIYTPLHASVSHTLALALCSLLLLEPCVASHRPLLFCITFSLLSCHTVPVSCHVIHACFASSLSPLFIGRHLRLSIQTPRRRRRFRCRARPLPSPPPPASARVFPAPYPSSFSFPFHDVSITTDTLDHWPSVVLVLVCESHCRCFFLSSAHFPIPIRLPTHNPGFLKGPGIGCLTGSYGMKRNEGGH